MKMVSAVIFDLDGVLVDSYETEFNGLKMLLKDLDVKVTDEQVLSIIGLPESDMLLKILPKKFHKQIDTLIKRRRKFRSKFYSLSKIYPDVKNVLDKLESKTTPVALASARDRASLNYYIRSFEIEKYFDVIVSGDDVKRGRPDPEMLLITAKKLGEKPNSCLVVGDTLYDALAAKRAGMSVVIITNNPYQIDRIKKLEVGIVENLTEILELI